MTSDCNTCSANIGKACKFYSPLLDKCDFPTVHDGFREAQYLMEHD